MNNDEPKKGPNDADYTLSDYVDGLIPDAERAAFDERLDANTHLRSELDGFETTLEALKRLPGSSAPDGFDAKVHAEVRPRLRASHIADLRTGRFPYEATFNILIIALLVGLYVSAMHTEIPSQPATPITNQMAAPADVERALKRHGTLRVKPVAGGVRYTLEIARPELNRIDPVIRGLRGLKILGMKANSAGRIVVELELNAR